MFRLNSRQKRGINKIKQAIKNLPPELAEKHREALAEGYKDEICQKCGIVFLAHHHFVRCDMARHGECPMVPHNEKSILEQLL